MISKTKLAELMKQHCILKSEIEDMCAFIADLLYVIRKDLETNEPYAINAIREFQIAETVVDNLPDEIMNQK